MNRSSPLSDLRDGRSHPIEVALDDMLTIGQNVPAGECDGAAYHSTVTARTRDRARQQHLEARGWRFHRIWSRSWFNNSDEEGRKLLEAFHNACAASGVPVTSSP